ncbi:MAG: MFS transporter, partial [Chloroflexota bacterium]
SLLFTVIGISQALTQMFLLKPLLNRFSEVMLIIIGGTLRAIALFLFSIAMGPWLAVLGSIAFPVGLGIMNPALQSLTTRVVDDELRGGILGLYQSVLNLSIVFGTGIGGVLFAITPATPYWVGTVLAVVAIAPTFLLLRLPEAEAPKGQPAEAGA